MSSTSYARRLKEQRSTIGGTVSKTSATAMKNSGTQNSSNLSHRSTIHGARQPAAIRPISGAEEPTAAGFGSGLKRSSSLGTKGRSPNTSSLIRVFKDTTVKRSEPGGATRLSSARKTRESEKLSDCKENNFAVGAGLVKKNLPISEKCQRLAGKDRNLSDLRCKNKNVMKEALVIRPSDKLSDAQDSGKVEFGLKMGSASAVKLNGWRKSLDSSCGKITEMDYSREKRFSDEGLKGRVGLKYTSTSGKLHEKLAFLEGKVKRIASDIKKTKEMLDLSNPDSSKVMLLDIQSKISGIEKVIGRAAAERLASSGEATDQKAMDEKKIEGNDLKSSIKHLNKEELEARLFPHQKLLRNRIMTKSVPGGCQENDIAEVMELSGNTKVDTKSLNLVVGNSITNEFLNSNGELDAAVTCSRKVNVDGKICEADESRETRCSGENDCARENIMQFPAELLTADEKFDEFDDSEKTQTLSVNEETEESSFYQLRELGTKNCTCGWFVSEVGSALLAHDDGSCSLYDIVNNEEKVVYEPPEGLSPNVWADCWVVRAPDADGCSGKFVVAASAGNSLNSAFCSWDFYSKEIKAFYTEDVQLSITTRRVLCPLSSNTAFKRNSSSNAVPAGSQNPWYRPCGALIISTSVTERSIKIFDIRDADKVMEWQIQKPVTTMDYSSPLQWRNRGKVIVAEADKLSVWDVNSLCPRPLISVSSVGRRICALHIVNTDAEVGGGIRQRVSSAEAEGNDGVFCTADSINVLDFRLPSGVGLKIPKIGYGMQSLYTRGDSIYVGSNKVQLTTKNQQCPQVLQFSLRKQKQVCTYSLPESTADPQEAAITQVWGNSDTVMASSGQGLFVFDGMNASGPPADVESAFHQDVKLILGPDNLCSPTFDYSSANALLISRDRPALWKTIVNTSL